jgi:hypothetical protein
MIKRPSDVLTQTGGSVLVINLKTAKALGRTIPRSLLQRADLVLECHVGLDRGQICGFRCPYSLLGARCGPIQHGDAEVREPANSTETWRPFPGLRGPRLLGR